MTKRYYWIKLKTDFFDLETIDWLISQKNGCEYVVLYQKLCLLTANKDGELASSIGEIIIPYDANKIARDTKFPIDTVIVALELFKKIGLIYEQENGILKIPYIADIVGSETDSAERVRRHRALQCNKDVTQNVTDSALQCNIDIEKDLETEKDSEKEKDFSLPDKSDGACSSSGTQKKEKSNKSQAESDFEECWSIYPKKQGKADARKAYLKFAKKDPELKEKVISGIRNYIEDIQRNKTPEQFIKHGSTFFNGEHWNDDYSARTGRMIETQPDSDTSEWDSIFEKL